MLHSISCLALLISGFIGVAPDPELQDIIKKFSGGASRLTAVEEFDILMERLSDLEAAADGDRAHLLQQIILVNYENRDSIGDPLVAAGIGSIATFLDFTLEETINAVIPMLESDDEEFRIFLNDGFLKLQEALVATKDGENKSIYDEILSDAFSGKQDMPRGLILKLISDDPNNGVRILILNSTMPDEQKKHFKNMADQVEKIYNRRETERNTEELTSGTSLLNEFSNNNSWWMRLYSVEIIQNDPKLGTPEIVVTLKNDRDRDVAKRMATK